MNRALSKLKKLRGRSLNELRVRGAQKMAAYAERRGWSAQARLPSDAALFAMLDAARIGSGRFSAEHLLDHFRGRTSPSFFASFADREQTLAELKRRWPRAEAQTVERADRIGAGRFGLLGLRDLYFGDPVDWHLEPVSGKKSPQVHWSRIEETNSDETGDKKVVWELNRHQHLVTLGRAYWFTCDERYAQTFVTHVTSWMERNPPKQGVNWISSLEIAFRSISWVWALHFFKDSPRLTPTLFLRMLKFLYLHARHLETYLSLYSSPNTHLTGEALGLFYLGTLLPEFRRAARWRETGRRILLAELGRHVRPDGVYFEQTSYYHRYTADFYTHLYVLTEANGARPEDKLKEKLIALLDHLMYITRPDGTTPFFGDDDGGRLLKLDERAPDDFRAALSTGAALFARPDYKYVAGGAAEETLWLLGSRGLQTFDRLEALAPAHGSRAFADGGYYVMRDQWTRDANYLLIDCGPHGTLNCGHAHADALAFDLAARGRTLLVDPGTYAYTGAREMRDLFRTSAAHNTLTIDDESSSAPGGPFSWEHVARAAARAWISDGRFDYFEGSHDGYMRLAAPATHTRSVLFVKGDYWIIRDRVETAGAHRYDLRFHFAPDTGPSLEIDGEVTAVRERKVGASGLETFAFGGEWREEDGWVSRCYGERERAPVLIFSATGEGAQDFITFLIPRGAESSRARVRELKTTGGRAFEVSRDGVRELLLIGNGGLRAAAAELDSDFEWTWARYTDDGNVPEQLVLINGHRLRLGGRDIFNSGGRVGYAVIRRVGGELLVETDATECLRVPVTSAGDKISKPELEVAK